MPVHRAPAEVIWGTTARLSRVEASAQTLALTDGRTPCSRLACQIELADAHDGLLLRMPTDQH